MPAAPTLAARSTDANPERATAAPRGRVVPWGADPLAYASDHEKATRRNFSQRLSHLKGYDFAGEYEPARSRDHPLYFAPSDTVPDAQTAHALGIADVHGLFGGVVPHPFVATKAITHGLAGGVAARPAAWAPAFAQRVSSAVLKGFSSFSHEDAQWTGRCLMRAGPACCWCTAGTAASSNTSRGRTGLRRWAACA